MNNLDQLHDGVVTGDAEAAGTITAQALAEGHAALALINNHMTPAMQEVGWRFESNEYFVPELMLSARAMKAGLELLCPLLVASGGESARRVVIGTVKGDLAKKIMSPKN